MSTKAVIVRNKKRESVVALFKDQRAQLKSVVKSGSSIEERMRAQITLSSLPRNSSSTRIANRCGSCGKKRSFYRKIGLCRNCLRKLASEGYIPGLTKHVNK